MITQGLIEVPKCSYCHDIMYKELSIILSCRHAFHKKCARKLYQTQSKCPLCSYKVKDYLIFEFKGEEHQELVNKDLMPKCVAEKMQMFEDEILRFRYEKLKLEELQQKKKQEIESLKNKTNSNLISLLQDIDQNQNRICQYEQRIELLKKQSKAFKQQADYEEQFNLGVRPIGIQNKENKEQ